MELIGLLAVVVAGWFLLKIPSKSQLASSPSSNSISEQTPSSPSSVSDYDASAVEGPSGLENFLQGIYHYEGGNSGDRNVRNNNPGNMKLSNAPGQIGVDHGFAIFETPEDGWAALDRDVKRKIQAHPGWDFYDFFNYWLRGSVTAPAIDAEGNSDSYAEYVAQRGGFDPTQPVSSILGG
jgi:hypothetical protein